jgi:PEP-CTERM motif-containing protein
MAEDKRSDLPGVAMYFTWGYFFTSKHRFDDAEFGYCAAHIRVAPAAGNCLSRELRWAGAVKPETKLPGAKERAVKCAPCKQISGRRIKKMHRLRLSFTVPLLIIVSGVVFCAGTASANSVNMQLTGVGGNNAGGVYTYPYYFSINGAKPLALICDTYDNQVVVGETWQANVVGLLSGKGLFGNQLLDYKAAGLIFKAILNGTVGNNAGNFAIWGLFSTNAQNNSYFQSSGAAQIENSYLGLAATAKNSAFSGLALYRPIAGTQSWGGTAQEYIVYSPSPVPEPSSLMLFATGLFSLAGLVRRKLGKA